MKVNQTQIEDLYAFTRKHFVEWYDLQTDSAQREVFELLGGFLEA